MKLRRKQRGNGGKMDGKDFNNIDNNIPREIPIPGTDGQEDTMKQTGNDYGVNIQENAQVERNGMAQQQGQGSRSGYYNDPYHHNPYQDSGNTEGATGQPYALQMNGNIPIPQPYMPKGSQKGTSAKIIIGVACAFAAIFAVGIGVAGYLRSRPTYKIAKGLQNLGTEIGQTENPLLEKIGYEELLSMMGEEGSHVDSTLDFSMDIPYLGSTTFGIDTDCYKDMEAKELSSNTSLSIMNYDFAHLNIYADKDVFCFSVPELFIEDMYIDNENVLSQYNNSILADGAYLEGMEDFSIELFPEGDTKTALDVWRNLDEIDEHFEADLDACRKGMKIEKAGKGLYRVVFPAKETNRLLKNFAESYSDVYGMQEDMELLLEYDETISTDVSLLFEINGHNRIESIMIENPVGMLDGRIDLEGEIFFLGEKRSVDKMQGKIIAFGDDDESREILWQIQQTASKDTYAFDMDVKMSEDGSTVGKIKLAADCDAPQNRFGMTFTMKDEWDDIKVEAEGKIEDIVMGKSMTVELENLALHMNGEELYKITGDIFIEPLRTGVKRKVQAKTAFFDMSWEDWFDVIEQIDDEYGSLLDSLW